jgi:hypothetical protein
MCASRGAVRAHASFEEVEAWVGSISEVISGGQHLIDDVTRYSKQLRHLEHNQRSGREAAAAVQRTQGTAVSERNSERESNDAAGGRATG